MRSIGLLLLIAAIAGAISDDDVTIDILNYRVILNVQSMLEKNLTISGNTKIYIHVMKPINSITLNARSKIQTAKLITIRGAIEIKNFTKDESSSRVTLHFPTINIGLYSLVIKHTSKNIPDNQPETSGIVRKVYSSESQKKYNLGYQRYTATRSYMLLSRLEKGTANNVFPHICFPDNETELSAAPYEVTIRHPPQYHVLSNIPRLPSDKPTGAVHETSFKEVYNNMLPNDLVFFVSKLVKKTHKNFTLWVEADMIDSYKTKFVYNFTQRALKKIGIKLHNIDLVALPLLPANLSLESDLDSELKNPELYGRLGLAFANLYLFDNPTTTFIEGRNIDRGDYASCMAKYDENTFDQMHGVTQIKVMRALVNQFIGGHLDIGNSKPLEEFDNMLTMYLAVYYVNLMYPDFGVMGPYSQQVIDIWLLGIERTIPSDVFTEGLHNYYHQYAYKPVNCSEIIRIMEEVVSKELNEVTLNALIDNPGIESFPMINVTRNYETGDVHISQLDQSKYFHTKGLVKQVAAEDIDEYIRIDTEMEWYRSDIPYKPWWLPIKVFNAENDITSYLLQPSKNLTLNGIAKSNEILIVESKMPGKYLVNYDIKNWNLIIDSLTESVFKSKKKFQISEVNISKVAKDAHTLSIYGRLELDAKRKLRLRKIMEVFEYQGRFLERETVFEKRLNACKLKPEMLFSDFDHQDLTFEKIYNDDTYLYN